MEYKLDFEVILDDPERTVEFGPSWAFKKCTECLIDKRIDNYYTVESGRGIDWGYVSVGKCKQCWNNPKSHKPRGFKNMDLDKQEKALNLIATTKRSLKEIAKDCDIPYPILSHYMRTKDLTKEMKKEKKKQAADKKEKKMAAANAAADEPQVVVAINKYASGKIYELVNLINGMKYYGSTCDKLDKRKSGHDSLSKVGSTPLYVAMQQNGCANFQITLVKDFPCNSKIELENEESRVIETARANGELLYNKNRPAVASTPKTIIQRAQAAAWIAANANKHQCPCCQFASHGITLLESHLKSAGCRNKMPDYLLQQEILRLNEIDY